MSQKKHPAYEGLFAVIDGQDTPNLDDPELIASALDYLEEIVSSSASLHAGTQGYRWATRTYSALLDAVIRHLDEVTNMRHVLGHRAASLAFKRAVTMAGTQARIPWREQLSCIRHLAETGFSVLPDRLVRIHAEFRPGRPLDVKATDVIRLAEGDMANDEERAAFKRLVALDERNWHLRHPRPIQYVEPNPESIESFHDWTEHQIEDLRGMLRSDGPIVEQLRQDDADYAETVHAMRVKATELAERERDDLPTVGPAL